MNKHASANLKAEKIVGGVANDQRHDSAHKHVSGRAVYIAAAQLLVRVRGRAIDLFDAPPFGAAPLDLEGRSRVVAAGTPELCRKLAGALSA